MLSQSSHPLPADITIDDISALTERVQKGGDEVVAAKEGTGSATLSMAYAGAEFAFKLLRAIKGEEGIVAPTYVSLSLEGGKAIQEELSSDVEYFSAKVELSAEGVRQILPLGQVSDFETKKLQEAIPELKGNITKACTLHLCMAIQNTEFLIIGYRVRPVLGTGTEACIVNEQVLWLFVVDQLEAKCMLKMCV